MLLGRQSWAWKGVARMFSMFDGDGNGVLDVHEMNLMQGALHNPERYTQRQFREVCTKNGAEWRDLPHASPVVGSRSPRKGSPRRRRPRGGITCQGLFTLYQKMGMAALQKDMGTLHIPAETAEEQLAMMRRAVSHLKALETRVKVRLSCRRLCAPTYLQDHRSASPPSTLDRQLTLQAACCGARR